MNAIPCRVTVADPPPDPTPDATPVPPSGPVIVRCSRATREDPWVLEAPCHGGTGWAASVPATTHKQVISALVSAVDRDIRVAILARCDGMWRLDCADAPALVTASGAQEWYRNGLRHRDGDLPAEMFADGYKAWYRNGKTHRDGDLPAVVRANGYQAWYREGKRHRDAGRPAEVHADGSMAWWCEGELHRDADLPADVSSDGTHAWYRKGRLHRVAGPAVVKSHGALGWMLEGKDLSASVNELLDCLARGGRVVEMSAGATVARVSTIAGDLVEVFQIASRGWVDWIVDNRDQHAPELAAAMRAKAIRDGASVAVGPGAPAQAAVPAAPRRHRL